MSKVILFSPSGYIGSFIKNRFLKEKNISFYEITRDSDLAQYAGTYDVLIYSAAVSNATVEKYIHDNVVTALSMINFCKLHNVKRIIYLSSDSIYGEINMDEVSETAIMVNPGIYGTTKYLAEKIIDESGIPYYIIRMPGVVGGMWRNVFICNLMTRIKNNEYIELYNIDRKFNNILYIYDLLDFLILLNNRKTAKKNEIFLLGNMEKIELREIVDYIKSLYHSNSQISNIDTNERRYFTLDVKKAVEYGYISTKMKTIIDNLYYIQPDD